MIASTTLVDLARRWRSDETATTAIEFAVLCIPLILMIFGFLVFGYVLHAKSELKASIDAATRHANINGAEDLSAIEAVMEARFGEKIGELDVGALLQSESGGQQVVELTATWTVDFGITMSNLPTRFSFHEVNRAELAD